jgi:hypothetical protein
MKMAYKAERFFSGPRGTQQNKLQNLDSKNTQQKMKIIRSF